jgi:hypothetical protein
VAMMGVMAGMASAQPTFTGIVCHHGYSPKAGQLIFIPTPGDMTIKCANRPFPS